MGHCQLGDYDSTDFHNHLVGEEGGSGGHHQLGDYDSTEIHNHLVADWAIMILCRPMGGKSGPWAGTRS